MAIKPLLREVDKPRPNRGPIMRSFYTREFVLDEDDKRRIRACRNLLPANEKIAGEKEKT